ncbi:unnamed protein product [Danaus chrysippus]|uniref:(African queen) hypothetical protein n=1 Tax=Danaus chrysippus TaxID=151541 RepID=A0A8J2M8N8_9NEOP|nr:unnamed protein product [Danaus chrysippus]
MVCQRCQKSLRGNEGVKCAECESRYHVRCLDERNSLEMESGDRRYHWICATCQTPASKTNLQFEEPQINQRALINAINALTEKFELMNKIQIPKLSNDLLQIRCVTDRIIKQNESLILKVEELKRCRCEQRSQMNNYRRRNLNLSPRRTLSEEQIPILGGEKIPRYRTRRRSYPLLKMLLQFNRKLSKYRTPRKR